MNGLFITEKNGRRRRAEEHVCENKRCGKTFLRRKYEEKHRKYCGVDCSSECKRNRVKVICSQCNKEFEKVKSSLKNSKHKHYFCSRDCKDTAQSLSGNCDAIRPHHYGTSNGCKTYIKSSCDALCSDCGERRIYTLCVHHIDGDRDNNPEDGSNWEVLCRNCHTKRHLRMDENGEWILSARSLTPRDMLDKL